MRTASHNVEKKKPAGKCHSYNLMFSHRLSISFLGQLRARNLCARHQRGGACSTDEQGHLSLCAARVPVVVVTNDTWFSIWTETRGSVLQQSLWFEVSISIIFYLLSSFSPDVILCGWLGLKHQLTNLLSTALI